MCESSGARGRCGESGLPDGRTTPWVIKCGLSCLALLTVWWRLFSSSRGMSGSLAPSTRSVNDRPPCSTVTGPSKASQAVTRVPSPMPGNQTSRPLMAETGHQALDLTYAQSRLARSVPVSSPFSRHLRWITPGRSTVLYVIAMVSSVFVPPDCKRGHFRIGQRGHASFGLTRRDRPLWAGACYVMLREAPCTGVFHA